MGARGDYVVIVAWGFNGCGRTFRACLLRVACIGACRLFALVVRLARLDLRIYRGAGDGVGAALE